MCIQETPLVESSRFPTAITGQFLAPCAFSHLLGGCLLPFVNWEVTAFNIHICNLTYRKGVNSTSIYTMIKCLRHYCVQEI